MDPGSGLRGEAVMTDNASAPVPSHSAAGAALAGKHIPVDIIAQFRELWSQKHELKRKLKKFDDEFAAEYQRQPTKAEKEVTVSFVCIDGF